MIWQPSPKLQALVLRSREVWAAYRENGAKMRRDIQSGLDPDRSHHSKLYQECCRVDLAAETLFKLEMRGGS